MGRYIWFRARMNYGQRLAIHVKKRCLVTIMTDRDFTAYERKEKHVVFESGEFSGPICYFTPRESGDWVAVVSNVPFDDHPEHIAPYFVVQTPCAQCSRDGRVRITCAACSGAGSYSHETTSLQSIDPHHAPAGTRMGDTYYKSETVRRSCIQCGGTGQQIATCSRCGGSGWC